MIVHVLPQHIREVIEDLSEQTRMEMQAAGFGEEELLPRFLRFMMSAQRAEGHALLSGGRSICVMAIAEHDGVVATFMIAGNGFFEESLRSARAFREYMVMMVGKFGPIHVFSRSPHPMAGKWFKMLGGKECPRDGAREKVFRWG